MATDPLALVNLTRLRTLLREAEDNAEKHIDWCAEHASDGSVCSVCATASITATIAQSMLDALLAIVGEGGVAGQIASLALLHASALPVPQTRKQH